MKITTKADNNELVIHPSYILGSNSKDWKHYIFVEEYDRRNKILEKMQNKWHSKKKSKQLKKELLN